MTENNCSSRGIIEELNIKTANGQQQIHQDVKTPKNEVRNSPGFNDKSS